MTTDHRFTHSIPRRGRGLHLVDIDNVLGGLVTVDRTRALIALHDDPRWSGPRDHLVVAGTARSAERWAFDLPPGARIILTDDQSDGPVRVLLEEGSLIERYGRLAIWSGCGAFTGLARQARGLGVHVSTVVGFGGLHRRLHGACDASFQLRLPVEPVPQWIAS